VTLALAFMAAVSAQDKPNFAGLWKTAGSFDSTAITVQGNTMTVTLSIAGNSESTVYHLDGTPSTKIIEGPMGTTENVYTSKWEGDVLVTTITAPGQERVERRSMEAGGTMRVKTVFVTMGGKPAPPLPPSLAAGMVFKRVQHPMERVPPPPPPPTVAVPAAILDRYVGEYTAANGFIATFRREGATLFVKPGPNDEEALIARTETRFQDPRGPVFEFQLDDQGKVIGAVLEQGAQTIPLQKQGRIRYIGVNTIVDQGLHRRSLRHRAAAE
jgi:hypothetical protein